MRLYLGALVVASLAGLTTASDDFILDVDVNKWAGTPLDFSYLNHSLTKADKVIVRGADFYRLGADHKAGTADDQPLRFFGVNLAFSANFPTATQADLLAKRLAILGVNVVRIHHIDTQFAEEEGNSRSGVLRRDVFPTFDSEAITRLKYLVSRLAQAGVYVNLNLHVGHTFKVERDQLTSIPPDFNFPYTSSPYHMIVPELIERQKQYACDLLAHLELKHAPPVLAMIEINNESSLVDAWQRGKLEPSQTREDVTHLRKQWQQFQQQKAWPIQKELVSIEAALADRMRYVEFLVSLDRAYLNNMKGSISTCLDGQVPMTGTQMAFGGLINQLSHQDMDFLDTHFYVDHYKFPQGWREDNWAIDDVSTTLGKFRVLSGVASLQQTNKPFTVSEFNQPWPNRFGQEIDLTTAAFGLLQGWDGLIHFNYSNDDKFEERIPKGFNLHGDPARLAAFGQAARLFRSQTINSSPLQLTVNQADAFSIAARGLKQREMGDEFYKLYKIRLNDVLNSRISTQISTDKSHYDGAIGRTGRNIRFDADARYLQVMTPTLWSISGKVDKGKLGKEGLIMTFPQSKPEFAMAVLSALDNKPVGQASRLLLSIPGPVWRSVVAGVDNEERQPETLIRYKTGWTIKSPSGKAPTASLQEGITPLWMSRVPARISLPLDGVTGVKVYPLNGYGQRMEVLPDTLVTLKEGRIVIDMLPPEARKTAWYELVLDKS